ncbi:unnamed protein product [Paramecium primaurelia]|uniref:S1-like domain-containing protein n=2 Tax=Paramecium TaxID=5884 RepID=A0A8S1N3V7_PARPR|nr:unnamed protein product [Paramecium primaurelia]CAD8099950.1 unnamed protein product [Paramecium primaurelia]CAD8188253.1 unnamed protein product [Paramecium pentaurelia]CAD8199599.1 unnamed protein product [Paramecium pentaurelia]
MPKNKGRGGKNYRRGKNENLTKRQLETKDDGQDYAQVIKLLGSGRLICLCLGDSKQRLGHIRGKMRRKVWIQNGDIVLVALREFQDEKCDVVYKYFPEEIKQLKNLKEIPENLEEGGGDNIGDNVVFVNKEESSSSDSDLSDSDSDDDSDSEPKQPQKQQPQKPQPQKAQAPAKDNKEKITKKDIDDI